MEKEIKTKYLLVLNRHNSIKLYNLGFSDNYAIGTWSGPRYTTST